MTPPPAQNYANTGYANTGYANTGYATAPRAPRQDRRIVVGLAVLVALLAVGGARVGAGFLGEPTDHGPGVVIPDEWDSRIEPIAQAVEDIRGLEFDHPVEARFLTEEEFTRDIRNDFRAPSRATRREVEALQAALRSVALAGPDIDLLGAVRDMTASSALAYYDPETKAMTIRGTELDPGLKVTIAHELTHALQDQNFGLDEDSFTALVEGDATVTEGQYAGQLSEAEQAQWLQGGSEDYDAATGEMDAAGVPSALRLVQLAPYTLGAVMVQVAKHLRPDGVDWLFAHQPRDEAAFLSPWTLKDTPRKASPPPKPTLAATEERLDRVGPLGAYGLYVMLAARIGPSAALRAADQWGGDRWVAFRRDGRECSKMSLSARTASGREVLVEALQQWAATLPPGTATVTVDGTVIGVDACTDPATTGALIAGEDATSDLPLRRNSMYADLLAADTGIDSRVLVCVADVLARDDAVTGVTTRLEQLTEEDAELGQQLAAQLVAAGRAAAASCR